MHEYPDSDDDVFYASKPNLSDYKNDGYEILNKFLYNEDLVLETIKNRKNDTNKKTREINMLKRFVHNMDKMFETKGKIMKKNTVLYRGMDINIFKDSKTVVMKNYISTSENINIAKCYTTNEDEEPTGCIYRLYIEPGIKYIKFKNDYERETLLPRGLTLSYIDETEDETETEPKVIIINVKV